MDPVSTIMLTFGVILLVIGWIQLMFTSFHEDFTWGLATVFVPPLSYIYSAISAFDKTKDTLTLTGIGLALVLFSL